MPRFRGHREVNRHDGSTADSWFGFTCGHCGTRVSGAVVASQAGGQGIPNNRWLACTECARGLVEVDGTIFPGAKFGPAVEGLPEVVHTAYDEARNCMQASAYTAAELVCRKILMHVAADKGAPEGEPFAAYLTYLEKQGYVTPPMKGWVDLIRKHGNEATHRLAKTDRTRAESTVMLTAELLRLVYEMEHMSQKYASPAK